MIKRKVIIIALVAVMSLSPIKSAKSGMIVDPATIAGNFGGMGQTISENITMAIQQVQNMKQTIAQGFSLSGITDRIKNEIRDLAGNLLNGKTFKAQVKDTKSKNVSTVKAEQDLYVGAAKIEYEEKINIAKENLSKDQKTLSAKEQQFPQLKNDMETAEAKYNRLLEDETADPSEKISAEIARAAAQAAYYKVVADIDELKASIKRQEIVLEKLEEEASKIGTEDDPRFMDYQHRIEETENQPEDPGLIAQTSVDKDFADLKDMEDFSIDETTYQYFIGRYFTNPAITASLILPAVLLGDNSSGREMLQSLQSQKDSIERQRKYLAINTITHLLQVSTTVRRELPIREAYAKSAFEKTKEGDELNAIVGFSNTQIEQSRALLLYARLQAAKLQYEAAREITTFTPEKLGDINENKYNEFDLGKYQLTKERIEEIIAKDNMSQTIDAMQNADIGTGI